MLSTSKISLSADACSTVVTTTSNSGDGSLRSAIDCANDLAGRQTISFNIAGAGPHIIGLSTQLPTISDATTVDGYTQAGAKVNTLAVGTNATLKIAIDGSSIQRDAADYTGNTLFNVVGGSSTAGSGTVIRGLAMYAQRNFQGGTNSLAVRFGGTGGHILEGCFVGTDVLGTTSIGNPDSLSLDPNGVVVASSNVTIGGTTITARNLISGLARAISIQGTDALVQNNLIGTNAAGNARIYTVTGVLVQGAGARVRNNVVTGPGAGQGPGGAISITNASDVEVTGNLVGTNTTGTATFGNSRGVQIYAEQSLSNIKIGLPGAGIIVREGVAGSVTHTVATNNSITGNSIFENGGLGINLVGGAGELANGVIPNDAGDADGGANALQNFPVITGVTPTTVSATLNSRPNQSYRVEFFTSDSADSSSYGKGQRYLGFVNTTTNDSGNSPTFTFTLPANQARKSISATATDASGNSSEFSLATGVPTTNPTATPRPTATPVVTPTAGPTANPRPTATSTPRPTSQPTATPRPTATATPRPTATATPRPTNTPLPTATPRPTATPAPQLSFSAASYSVTEGNSGTKNLVFTVVLSGTPSGAVSVNYATSNGTATAGSDYTATSGTLTFATTQDKIKTRATQALTQTISVPVRGDSVREADETFFVTLSNPRGATIGLGRAKGVILNDDSSADLSVTQTASASSVPMGTQVTFTLTVRNNGPDASQGVTLTNTLPVGSTFVASTPTATSQSNGTLIFALGALANGASRTISVQVRVPNSAGTVTNSATVAGSGALAPSPPNNGASASVVVTAGAPAFSFVLGKIINVGPYSPTLFRPGAHLIQNITITNTGTATFSSPLLLVLDGLPASVTLVGASGTTAGAPYLTLPNALGVGQSTTVRLEFRMTRSDKPLFSPRIINGALVR